MGTATISLRGLSVSQKILSALAILSMEKTMVTKVISELKSISRLKIFPESQALKTSLLPLTLLVTVCIVATT